MCTTRLSARPMKPTCVHVRLQDGVAWLQAACMRWQAGLILTLALALALTLTLTLTKVTVAAPLRAMQSTRQA